MAAYAGLGKGEIRRAEKLQLIGLKTLSEHLNRQQKALTDAVGELLELEKDKHGRWPGLVDDFIYDTGTTLEQLIEAHGLRVEGEW